VCDDDEQMSAIIGVNAFAGIKLQECQDERRSRLCVSVTRNRPARPARPEGGSSSPDNLPAPWSRAHTTPPTPTVAYTERDRLWFRWWGGSGTGSLTFLFSSSISYGVYIQLFIYILRHAYTLRHIYQGDANLPWFTHIYFYLLKYTQMHPNLRRYTLGYGDREIPTHTNTNTHKCTHIYTYTHKYICKYTQATTNAHEDTHIDSHV